MKLDHNSTNVCLCKKYAARFKHCIIHGWTNIAIIIKKNEIAIFNYQWFDSYDKYAYYNNDTEIVNSYNIF